MICSKKTFSNAHQSRRGTNDRLRRDTQLLCSELIRTMQETVGLTYWLTHWNWDVSLIVGFILVIGGYLYAIGPLRRTYHLGPPARFSRGLAFLLGADICFLALCSPLDALADTYLFSAHMLQHMLLSFAGAPLLVLGIPGWLLRPLLRYRLVLAIWKILTHPVVTSLLFSTNLWLWHAPLLYNATLYNPQLHIICHLLYIATGMLFWWPLLGPVQRVWPPLSLGGKLAYLFFNDMPMVLLGAGLTFMPPLYEPYLHTPRLWGITPALDQQLGGLLMWIAGSIFFIVLASIFFLRWMLQQENAECVPLTTGLDEAEEIVEVDGQGIVQDALLGTIPHRAAAQHVPTAWAQTAREDTQQGGFTRTVLADDADECGWSDFKAGAS